MRVLPLLLAGVLAIAAAVLGGPLPVASRVAADPRSTPVATVRDTSSMLAPADAGFTEAMALADHLQRAGLRIAAVHRSKFAGFLGQAGAASFASDRGAFAVVFFPEPDGAERVTVELKRRGPVYRYTFRWRDGGRARTERLDTAAPERYLRIGPWLVFSWADSTQEAVHDALTLPRQGVG